MFTDASAQVGVMQRQNVTITGIDNVFDVSCTAVQAAALLNAFTVTDVDAQGGLGLSAEVAVSFTNNGFSNMLAQIIANAYDGASADAAAKNLKQYLLQETEADLLKALAHDALANMLEASDLSVQIALDASSGAVNMSAELAGAEGSSSGANATQYRKALFTQIPEVSVHKYIRVSNGTNASGYEDVSCIRFLPLLTGDVLTFVFDVTVGKYSMGSGVAPANGANVQRVFRDNSSTYPTGTGDAAWNDVSNVTFSPNSAGGYVQQADVPYAPTGGLTFVAPTRRRLALKLCLGTDVQAGNAFIMDAATPYNAALSATQVVE
jgi:hypothetical protein